MIIGLFTIVGMTPAGMTPLPNGQSGETPLRTPMRDKLNINQMEDFESGTFEQVNSKPSYCLPEPPMHNLI